MGKAACIQHYIPGNPIPVNIPVYIIEFSYTCRCISWKVNQWYCCWISAFFPVREMYEERKIVYHPQ